MGVEDKIEARVKESFLVWHGWMDAKLQDYPLKDHTQRRAVWTDIKQIIRDAPLVECLTSKYKYVREYRRAWEEMQVKHGEFDAWLKSKK